MDANRLRRQYVAEDADEGCELRTGRPLPNWQSECCGIWHPARDVACMYCGRERDDAEHGEV